MDPQRSNPNFQVMKLDNKGVKSSLYQGFEGKSPSPQLKAHQSNLDPNPPVEDSQRGDRTQSDSQVESQIKKIFYYKALMTFNFFASVGNVVICDIDGSIANKADWMIACWSCIQFKMALSGVKERSESKIEQALVLMRFYLVLMGVSMLGKMYGETTLERDGRRIWEFSFDSGIFFGALLRMVGHLILNIWSTMKILTVLRSLNLKDKEGIVDDLKRELDTWPYLIYRYLVRVFYFWNLLHFIAFIWNEYLISFEQFSDRRYQCVRSPKSTMDCFTEHTLHRMKFNKVLIISTIEHIFVLPMLLRSMSFIYKGIEGKDFSKILAGIRWMKVYLATMCLFDIWCHVVWLKNGTLTEMYKARCLGGFELEPFAQFIVMLTFSLLSRGVFYYALMLGALRARDILRRIGAKIVKKSKQNHKEEFRKMSLVEKLKSFLYSGYKYLVLLYFCWSLINLIYFILSIYFWLEKVDLEGALISLSQPPNQSQLISELGFGCLKCLFSFSYWKG